MDDTRHHDAVGHTSADDQYLETPPEAGYEHTDASVWIVVKFLSWLIVAAIVIHLGLAALFNLFVEQRTERGEPRFPLAVTDGAQLPPEPRLQPLAVTPEGRQTISMPREQLMRFRQGEERVLQQYGWVDRNAGTVHIPINEAMRLLLERQTLPSRPPQEGAAPQPPGMMPADSSAGRTLERRRQ
jgi:hypothetical protein